MPFVAVAICLSPLIICYPQNRTMECDLLMIKIEKVINKNDLKAFIAFPSSLYPDDPNWIPPLFIERNEHLSAKNPGTDHIIWQAWVAKKAGQIVGRITAQIDTLHRERYGKDTGHFGMIDAIDDPQVFAALFGAAEAWLKSQGASKISGPFSLNINQESGLLIEGFDTPPCAMMPHGKPWYAAHIEQLGYHKGIDLLAWWMQRTDLTFSPALKKLMDQVRKKVTIRCINRQRFAEEMQILMRFSILAGSTTGDLCRLPNMNSRPWATNLNIWCRTI